MYEILNWLSELRDTYSPPTSYNHLQRCSYTLVTDHPLFVSYIQEHTKNKHYPVVWECEQWGKDLGRWNRIVGLARNASDGMTLYRFLSDGYLLTEYGRPMICTLAEDDEDDENDASRWLYWTKTTELVGLVLAYTSITHNRILSSWKEEGIEIVDFSDCKEKTNKTWKIRSKSPWSLLVPTQHTSLISLSSSSNNNNNNNKTTSHLKNVLSSNLQKDLEMFLRVRKLELNLDAKDDEDWLLQLLKQNKSNKTIYNNNNNNNNNQYKSVKREFASWFLEACKELIPFSERKLIRSVCDVGCANGVRTAALGRELFRFATGKITGVDVRDLPLEEKCIGWTFRLYDGYNIPSLEQQFDCILLLHVLHHVMPNDNDKQNKTKGMKKLVKSIYSCLKPGGWLILEEHDCGDPITASFLDLVHGIYAQVDNHEHTDGTFFTNFWSHYKTLFEWKTLLTEEWCDFQWIGHRYKDVLKDSQRRFVAIFRKPRI